MENSGTRAGAQIKKRVMAVRRSTKVLPARVLRSRVGIVKKTKSAVTAASSHKKSNIFMVEKILDDRMREGQIEYLIKWKNYGDSDNTWEYANNILDKGLIKKYNDGKGSLAEVVGPKLKRKASVDAERELKRTASATTKRNKVSQPVVVAGFSSARKKKVAGVQNEKPKRESPKVEDVFGIRRFKAQLEYFVKWRGCTEDENTWEPAANVPNKRMLKKFNIVDNPEPQ